MDISIFDRLSDLRLKNITQNFTVHIFNIGNKKFDLV